MEKIDRLGWAAGVCFQSYGLKIGVRVNTPEALERLPACLPPGWQPIAGPVVDVLFSLRIGLNKPDSKLRNYHLLYWGVNRVARTMDLDEVHEALESEVALCVGEWAPERIFVHAGVVGWKDRAILIPGCSMAGKSSLVAALLRAGATYYSDEYAVLDAEGRVYPYARRLSLRQPEGKPRRCSAEELGGRTGSEPLPVALVAAVKYRPGSTYQPGALTAGQTIMELMNRALPAQVMPERTLNTLQQMVPHSRNLKGLRGEAEETAEALLHEVES